MQYLKEAQEMMSENVEDETQKSVKDILDNVKKTGDKAVQRYEEELSKSYRSSVKISEEEIWGGIKSLSDDTKKIIDSIVYRVSEFAKAQLECIQSFEKEFDKGVRMGHRIIPVKKTGVYVPGGRFPLLSSGPMVTVPAKEAGVENIIACSPANYNSTIHPAVIYGLIKSGATEIYAIGGAQAIASMAFGTESISKVDVIAGPGNRFVAEAKRQVFGEVGIDLIAGPSEILVFGDKYSNPDKCAADLLAQAEHDPKARAILVTTSKQLANDTIDKIENRLVNFPEDSPVHESWENMGEVIHVDSIEEGIDMCNYLAIEHLHLHIKQSKSIMHKLYNYGSLFLGSDSSVVFSDKISGTNHTLPTQKSSRYTGGLSVYNFIKILTHQEITGEGVSKLASHATRQSEIEGLEGHKLSASLRL